MTGLPQGVAGDSRMVLFGLTDFIQRELICPINYSDISDTADFLKDAHSFGDPVPFDKQMWIRVLDKYNGFLPIEIKALPECSTFWPNEPIIEVQSLDEGFGEIAAIIEANLVGMVSCATARLTLSRHLFKRMQQQVKKYNPSYSSAQVDSIASFMVHDFGMRASSTPEEAEIYGVAHLLAGFNGTDTTSAAYLVRKNGAPSPIGTSILALAHRIVQSHDEEQSSFEALFNASQGTIGSYVGDCYNFNNAVDKFLVEIALRTKTIVVARPDSGDYIKNMLYVVDTAIKHDLFTISRDGLKEATNLRYILGDSMTWAKMWESFQVLERRGVNPTGFGIFGVGGWMRNSVNRDSLSSAYKLAEHGSYPDFKKVVKLSEIAAKMSIPGQTKILRGNLVGKSPTVVAIEEPGEDQRVVYYRGDMGEKSFLAPCLEDFNTKRQRCIEEFDSYTHVNCDYGTRNFLPTSKAIRDFQQEAINKYRGNK
jgi:nicotinamide phosphoribosyltransferase